MNLLKILYTGCLHSFKGNSVKYKNKIRRLSTLKTFPASLSAYQLPGTYQFLLGTWKLSENCKFSRLVQRDCLQRRIRGGTLPPPWEKVPQASK